MRRESLGDLRQDFCALLPAFHGLLTHLDQADLRVAIGKAADGTNSLVCVFSGQGTGQFNAITLVNNLTSLQSDT